ncbi:MAG: dihydroorotate dehydrogenase [Ignavibacteria bacterium RIFOXYB2_FULL_35_12]|nr:MAG: dihydroorotate dehydrogenase [Ignavibacteria bacterium GWA2_36_19]OGU58451.1 MAG: dihydroorotate dehydrogenase [Ignavibacteria bacterium GWF2_35_20]OGU78437.1 MAG: dihydroorotate dehydrogenase [Ignavibacteria bacterium RIFOXYA2_FULL_35_9]OGU88288.1 MAG: dihydroorotate dehydrogenase [Ignavibacteria bacterium RIFOXYC12_FULL_35_11]OGU91643.1 MAG: dihydroorotate dehydrogenase [Ignavibacteria bacterium RIFOXYA12_FULL_35_25]OGU97815.1 MAG: dihydroorotate dehydrogenase [Ignavibacteria bacteri
MNLTTNYLGLELKNPIIPSAGPLSQEISSIKAMEDAGAAAVVLYSLFEEEIEQESLELYQHTNAHKESFAEALDYFPEPYDFKIGPDKYLEHIRKAKEAVDIPIIASLNGKSVGGWIDYAKKIEQAGADALELNIYFLASDPKFPGTEIEREYLNIVKGVKMNVNIPIAVKMHPFFSSVSWMAEQLSNVGADGLVLFNRFYQPDINLETLEVEPNVLLSTPMAMRLPLRWISMLYGRVNADLAATSGIYSETDVIKMVMAGAKVTQMLSCLLKFGIGHITEVINQVVYWMEVNEYESLEQMRGSMSYKNVANPSQFERANYMKVLHSYK